MVMAVWGIQECIVTQTLHYLRKYKLLSSVLMNPWHSFVSAELLQKLLLLTAIQQLAGWHTGGPCRHVHCPHHGGNTRPD